jgi:iron complex transport system ATP-binding protein
MLSAQNITVRYGKKIALQSVSLNVAPGEIVVLVGPNGSGKSTLLRALSGNVGVQEGQVLWDETPLAKITPTMRQRTLAFVPQETAMPFAYTVEECVGLGEQSKEAREAAIEIMELDSLRHTPLPQLSGGERQRAGIARGIAQQTPYLLLDEPTAHLDARYHDLARAAQIADRVLLLQHGTVQGEGESNVVLTAETLERVYQVDASYFLFSK